MAFPSTTTSATPITALTSPSSDVLPTEAETERSNTPPSEISNPDVTTAVKALVAKNTVPASGYSATDFWNYYDGKHPLLYTSRRLEDIFRRIDAKYVQNWCAVVIDSVAERLNLSGITISGDPKAQTAINDAWLDQQLNLESDDIHLAALVAGEAYAIVWPDADEPDDADDIEAQGTADQPDDPTIPQLFFNDSRSVYLQYDPERPRRKLWAAKWWIDNNNRRRLTMYYADHLEYYISNREAKKVTSVNHFVPLDIGDDGSNRADNPYGQIPVFHFRLQRRITKSDLANIITIQNAINKLLNDMMVAAEFTAFRQRWVISAAGFKDDQLENKPNVIWDLPAGDGQGQQTTVGEFSANDLDNFLKPIAALADSIAAITRTPKHYLFQQGGDPSGEALMALEAPLVKKVKDRIERFTPVWTEITTFMLLVMDITVEQSAIVPVFDDPRTIQPATTAEIRKADIDSGLPLVTALKREGWTQQQIDDMLKDKAAEEAAALAVKEQEAAITANAATAATPPAAPPDPQDVARKDADMLKVETAAGIPLSTALRKRGWTSAQIDELLDDMRKEASVKTEIEENAQGARELRQQRKLSGGPAPARRR